MDSKLREADVLVPALEILPVEESPAADKHTYGQILKSSALIGGSSVLNLGIGMVRTKAMAVLLGPAGFGLMGLYGSIADLAVSIAGYGHQQQWCAPDCRGRRFGGHQADRTNRDRTCDARRSSLEYWALAFWSCFPGRCPP